jgi:hypothetical protein
MALSRRSMKCRPKMQKPGAMAGLQVRWKEAV